MPSQPRLRPAPMIMGLGLWVLPAAIAQIQPVPFPSPGLGSPTTSPPPNGTPSADPQGNFAPSTPGGPGSGAPQAPTAAEPSESPAAPDQGLPAGSPAAGVGAGGAPPSAFGSVNDFSAELGIRQLIDPNSPDFQPLSLSEFRLVQPARSSTSNQDGFGLGGGALSPIGPATSYRERFARTLVGSPGASLPASESDGGRGGRRQGGGRLGWPAIQSSSPG